jgi:hypothetical protein
MLNSHNFRIFFYEGYVILELCIFTMGGGRINNSGGLNRFMELLNSEE